MRVWYRGEEVDADQLTTSGGQVFWQIGRSFIPDSDVAIPESPRFTSISPPPPPPLPEGLAKQPVEPPAEVVSSKSKRGKKAAIAAPVVDGHDDPPQGGDLSEAVADPRDR